MGMIIWVWWCAGYEESEVESEGEGDGMIREVMVGVTRMYNGIQAQIQILKEVRMVPIGVIMMDKHSVP